MTKEKSDNAAFDKAKARAEERYKKIGEVRCPYLGCAVRFAANGLEHIKFTGRGRSRPKHDQLIRLKLLHLAPKVVGMSHTLQGIQQRNQFETIKVNKRREKQMKLVTYYEFVAVLKGTRVKVIVKRVGGGEPPLLEHHPLLAPGERRQRSAVD